MSMHKWIFQSPWENDERWVNMLGVFKLIPIHILIWIELLQLRKSKKSRMFRDILSFQLLFFT